MSSTQRYPHTVNNQLNRDNEKEVIFDERSTIYFLSMTQLKE